MTNNNDKIITDAILNRSLVVWVGAEPHVFSSANKALEFYAERRRQYGQAEVVQVTADGQECANALRAYVVAQ